MKETPIHAAALQLTHRSRVTVGKNGLRIVCCDRFQPGADGVEGFIPGDAGEPAIAFIAGPFHRM